jgi:uncharacterized protein (TIGR03067 family)
MKSFLPLIRLALVSAATCSFTSGTHAQDKDSLVGEWAVVQLEYGGKAVRDSELLKLKIEFTATRMIVELGGDKKSLSYTLTPGKSPPWLDTYEKATGKTIKGICRLTGIELRICADEAGLRRPDDFSSKVGSKVSLIVLRRVPQ